MIPLLPRLRPADSLASLYVMRGADALASTTVTYAIPLLVLLTTGSTALTGIAFLLEWTPRLAAYTAVGSLVDRFGARRVFRLANLARTACITLAAVLLFLLPTTGTATTSVVLAFGSIAGLLAEFTFVAIETEGALTSRRAAHPHHVQAMQTGIDQGTLLVGPLLGSLLLLASPGALLTVVAVLTITAALIARGSQAPLPHTAVRSSLVTGWRTLRRTPALAWLVGGLAASNLATGILQAAAPITVIHRFHHSTVDVGALWSAAAVASLAAVIAARRAIDRWRVWPVGALTAIVVTAACAATALAPTFPTYIAAVAVVMAAEGAMTVVLRTLRSRLIPPTAFGSTLAVMIILITLPMPLAGALVAAVPAPDLPHLLLACTLLQGLVLAGCFTGLRRHPTPPTQSVVVAQQEHRALQAVDES